MPDEAWRTYQAFARVSPLSASFAASGPDPASHSGRFSEAVRVLEEGAAADRAAANPDWAAAKLAAVASAELSRGRKDAAVAAAKRALDESQTTKICFLAGRIFAQAGQPEAARDLAKRLADELPAEPGNHARFLEGELALAAGDPRGAITLLGEANGLLDTWIGRFTLGRAYLEAGAFAQADSELDRCAARRGEALALFLDEEPTFAFDAPPSITRAACARVWAPPAMPTRTAATSTCAAPQARTRWSTRSAGGSPADPAPPSVASGRGRGRGRGRDPAPGKATVA